MGHDDPSDPHHHHAHEAHEAHEPEQAHVATGVTSASSFHRDLGRCARVVHVDPIAGAAGDMLIAALLDLGVPQVVIEGAVRSTGLTGYRLEIGRRDKHAIAAKSFDVIVDGKQPPRDYATIEKLLSVAPLEARVKELARHTFLRLGEAEAKVHRQPLSSVHFHEVGGVDAIVDVVGACAGLAWLEADAGGEGRLGVSLGALPVGGGRAKGAHGSIPVPAPAALELMIGLPTRDAGVDVELVTPTGAALLRAFVERLPSALGAWPSFSPRSIGYGAGRRNLVDRPNVVRLVLGDVVSRKDADPTSNHAMTHVVLETNVDDTTGEVAAAAIEALLTQGALDAWAQPITMKKGRPALIVGAIVEVAKQDELARAMLAHTGSLGVRRSFVSRIERPRRFVDVDTVYGSVRVKIADGDGLPKVIHPEHDACRARAKEHDVPVREVIRAAIAATPA